MSTKILTREKLRPLVQELLQEELAKFFVDPDAGWQLRAPITKRLERSRRALGAGQVRSLEEVVARLKIKV